MSETIQPVDERVLALSALPANTKAICKVAAEAGLSAQPCGDMAELCAGIREGAGAAVVTEFVLSDAAFAELAATIRAQPTWSDFPLVLVALPDASLQSEEARHVIRNLGNVVVLESPLSTATLVSALETALRGRRRQYEVRRAQRLVQESLDRERARTAELEAMMDAVPAALYIARDPECREIVGSRLGYEMLRLPPGSNLSQSAPEGGRATSFRVLKDGHEIPPHELPMQKAAFSGQPVRDYEFELAFNDGTSLSAFGSAVPLIGDDGRPRGAVGAFLDISERKRAEAALRESERNFRELADLMPQLVWVADASGSVIYANHQWYANTGTPTEQCFAEGWLEAIHPEDRDRNIATWRRSVETGAPYQIEHRLRDTGGEYRWFLTRALPIRNEQGRVVRWFGTSTDIEDTKRAEEHLRHTQKLETIGMLAGGIAHDFNNIMAVIMGNASLIVDEVGPGPAEKLNLIIGDAEKAAHLTRQLLAYAGKGQVIVRDLDVAEVLNRAAELVRPSIPKTVDLLINVNRRLPTVRMDESQLKQIVVNLLMNAGEAIGEGKPGKITVGTSLIDIKESFLDAKKEEVPAGRFISIEVSDTGAGIVDKAKSRLFDPFFTTKFIGRGMGLAAVAGIVRTLKGGIRVESALGMGSSFQVLLPVAERVFPQNENHPCADRGTVLVVDDEPAVRDFIAAVLRRKGYRTLMASDGREALAVCDRVSDPIDAVVLDMVMPFMGAKELMPALRARQPDAKILFTSAYEQAGAGRLCSEYPGSAFIQKPYTASQLARALDELLSARGGQGEEMPRWRSVDRR